MHLHLPLWNPNAGAGAPLLADGITAPLDPLRLPIFLSPGPGGWNLYLGGRFLLAGLFILLYARELRLSLPAQLVSTLGYLLTGFFILGSNNPFLDVYFSLPLVLLAIELVLRKTTAWCAALLAATVAVNLLSGLPEASFVTLLFSGGYALYRFVIEYLVSGRSRVAVRPAVLLVVGFSTGFALAAPFLVPFLEYLSRASTIHTSDALLGFGALRLRWALSLLVPYVNGRPLAPSQPGTEFFVARNYIGVVLPILAVLGLWHRPLARRVGWYFLAAAAIAIAKTYGMPGINDLGRLPIARLTIFYIWSAPAVSFCVAILAGMGTDRIYRGEQIGSSLVVAVAALVGLALPLLYLNLDVIAQVLQLQFIWFEVALGAAVLAAVVILIGQGSTGKLAAWVCLALVMAELLLLAPSGIYPDRYDTFARPPFVAFLQAKENEGGRSRIFGTAGLLYPDDASAFNLDDIRTLNALYPERYFRYIQQFISPTVADRFVGSTEWNAGEGEAKIADNPMLDLLGVQYVIAPNGATPEFANSSKPGMTEQFKPVYDGEVRIYQNTQAFPRAFAVSRVRAASSGEAALAAMSQPGFDPRDAAVVEGPISSSGKAVIETTSDSSDSAVHIKSYQDQKVVLDAAMQGGGLVVLSDVSYPGWKASVDGKPANIYTTDYAFRGVFVPDGSHRVVFEYDPASFKVGLLVAVLAASGLLLWWIIEHRGRTVE
jgi:hypothetical protein